MARQRSTDPAQMASSPTNRFKRKDKFDITDQRGACFRVPWRATLN
jgi:hypothetical protein